MKTTLIAIALAGIVSTPAAFAANDTTERPNSAAGASVPVVNYQYGMDLDIATVLSRTDNSLKAGIVPTVVVYRDHQGNLHRVRYLEWGGLTTEHG
ncbi:DUF2790 domain-containing protein [Pseudomonas sp. Marseille-QA0892]